MKREAISSLAKRKSYQWRIRGERIGVYALLVIFAVAALIPIIIALSTSLKTGGQLYENILALPTAPEWKNYIKVWINANFSRYFLNSIIVSAPTTLMVLFFAALAGYAFAKLKFFGKRSIFFIFLLGLMIPVPSIIIPIYFLLKDLKILNTYLGLIIPQVALGLPFGVFLMTTFFREIPEELLDSARIDGCNTLQILTKIILPISSPALKALVVIEFMWAWNSYFLPMVIIQRDEFKPLTVGLDTFIGRYTINYPMIAAACVIIFVPIVVLYFFLQKEFVRGITFGAIKG